MEVGRKVWDLGVGGGKFSAMRWPGAPTCHEGHPALRLAREMRWREPVVPEGERSTPFRTCSFCGCIHPEDLVKVLGQIPPTRTVSVGMGNEIELSNVEVADWKYGYPHKIYVKSIPHEHEGRQIRVGTEADDSPIIRAEGKAWAKFYTQHLLDDGFDDEALRALTDALLDWTGIRFTVDAGSKIHYQVERPKGVATDEPWGTA